MKIVINTRSGALSVSKAVYNELGLNWDNLGYLSNDHFNIDSTNPDAFRAAPELIEAIEKLGDAANSPFSLLRVVEIQDGVKWAIIEYDGGEKLCEIGRAWS